MQYRILQVYLDITGVYHFPERLFRINLFGTFTEILAHILKAKIEEISIDTHQLHYTLYPTLPFYNIIIIFGKVVTQKINIEHEKQ